SQRRHHLLSGGAANRDGGIRAPKRHRLAATLDVRENRKGRRGNQGSRQEARGQTAVEAGGKGVATLFQEKEGMTTLPIPVLVPTLNCADSLPAHIDSMREWAEQVEEIVVVDSFSDDNTMAVLKESLTYPHVRFLQHPRGLYQSWNFGIQHLRAKYAYI